MDRSAFGLFGERLAERYLTSRGYRVIERRWRTRTGEIDLIAYDGDEVVFVEVKARRTASYGLPEESVDDVKAARLRAAAYAYLARTDPQPDSFRIDVIAVHAGADGKTALRHYRSAVAAD